jgi:carboxyl-terminal processing protease
MRNKERYIWLGSGLLALAVVALVSFGPTAIAQPKMTESEEYLETFEDIFRYIEENFVEEIDPKMLFEGALDGMFDVLDDPYSYYLDDLEMDSLGLTTNGNFGGVGLTISKQSRSDVADDVPDAPRYIEVVSPIDGTPGYRAGINAGDLITEINGDTTAELSIDEAVELIRGVPGTNVDLTIGRGPSRTFTVTVTRDIIEVPTVRSAMVDDDIAYLKITQFTPFTDDRVKEAIEDFEAEDYSALVIDVRNNPGGRLSTVIEVADMFLDDGTIVSTRSRVPRENDIFSASRSTLVPQRIPIVILVNKGSASASEILAGALRDNDRATIVGETSYGKGSVQQVRDFGDGGFRLTTSRYYTPSGKNIDKIGINPDTAVSEEPFTEEEESSIDRLNTDNTIGQFVDGNPNPSEADIAVFVRNLHEDDIVLEDRLIRRLVRNEVNRTNNEPPVYDLEFDLALQEAVKQLGGL